MEALAKQGTFAAPQLCVCVWRLKTTDPWGQPQSHCAAPGQTSSLQDPEAVFATDGRKRVAAHDYEPGGKYQGQPECFHALWK